jgi:hypothetical protein
MEQPDRIIALLEEIRDHEIAAIKHQKAWVDEYRQWMERSERAREESLRQQLVLGTLYKRVVIVSAVLVVGAAGCLGYLAATRS